MKGIHEDIEDFYRQLSPVGPLIGLDVGSKTIGLAVSDGLRLSATPLSTITRQKLSIDVQHILSVADERNVAGFILGLPLNMNGTEGPRCQSVRAFARNFKGFTEQPVSFWDERLSTFVAESVLIQSGASRRKRKRVVNHIAAAIILQRALDRLGNLGTCQP